MTQESHIKELLTLLMGRVKLSEADTKDFVDAMFGVIRDALMRDRVVKIKGLGTFKVIDVEPRESVNVNTGGRMLIESHSKVAFTPDATMKELVNKPFSQFETVVLNDGIDFGEEPETLPETPLEPTAEPTPEPAPEPATEEPTVVAAAALIDEEPLSEPIVTYEADEPALEVGEDTQTVTPEELPEAVLPSEASTLTSAPLDYTQPEEEIIAEAPLQEEAEEEVVPPSEEAISPSEDTLSPSEETLEEPQSEPESDAEEAAEEAEVGEEEEDGRRPAWQMWAFHIVGCLVLVGASMYGGFVLGQHYAAPSEPLKPVSAPKVAKVAKVVAPQKPQPADTLQPADSVRPAVKAPVPKADSVKAAPAMPDYDKMDVRVRTGAYRIVGLNRTVKARAGESVKSVANRTLGPGMECYIEVYNGYKADLTFKEGQEVKIPDLRLKKRADK